ncbi:MAG: hypothetical protein C1942_00870 [Prosthecochloris sp.]|uniref:PIN domain-containing protein n=1 Tax=Prosthecochloris sp. TaxID=290513 RepID=UPI0013CC86F9|nr:PIN domain-containing protein [Prosthecochloris sp.]NEX11248.1 hypothetical protein [Prosthecochloris sp.]
MIHIVLDTNIYRQNPTRDSLNFKAIEKLAEANWVKIHIPYIVEREFQTQQREICHRDLNKALSGLNGLSRKQLSPHILKKVEGLKGELENSSEDILSDAENQFTVWANQIKANRIPLCIEQTSNAIEAYFQGNPPFKSAKVRDDIPDSFLVQAILKLKSEFGELHVVAEDNKVRQSFLGNDTIMIYSKFSNFIESELVQEELKDLDFLDGLDKIIESLKIYEQDHCEISSAVNYAIGEKLIGKTINHHSIHDDNNEATIDSYYDPEDLQLNYDDVSYFGNGLLGIPFNLKILIGAYYYIFKADYYVLDIDEQQTISVSDHNDHYYMAESDFKVLVRGHASIRIDRENINLENLSESVFDSSISLDDVESIELC